MSSQEEYWLAHLAAIEREGISVKAYAEREKVSAWSLYDRRRKLKAKLGTNQSEGCGFVAVQVPLAATHESCRLKVGEQLELELPALPTPAWLAALWAALSGRGC